MSDSLRPRGLPHQASLSVTISQSLLKLTSIESVMPSNHLVLCHPLLLLLINKANTYTSSLQEDKLSKH